MPPQSITRKFIRELLGSDRKNPPKKIGLYSAQDVEFLFTFLAGIPSPRLKSFLAEHKQRRSGNKVTLFKRIKKALDAKTLKYKDLIGLLDDYEPWSKQHILVFDAVGADPTEWNEVAKVEESLPDELKAVLNARRVLLLPDKLTISEIEASADRLRVTAVERRVGYERQEDLSYDEEQDDGSEVAFRAYVKTTTRGLMILEWDLTTNTAFVQITQLPQHERYELALARFAALLAPWLPEQVFNPHNIERAIVEFRRRERDGEGGVRSHRVELEAIDGRRISGTSTLPKQPLLGNDDIDTALGGIEAKGGTGHMGNFYLLADSSDANNPIATDDEVHVTLMGNKNRFNIMTPQNEEIVRHAIRSIRDASNAALAGEDDD